MARVGAYGEKDRDVLGTRVHRGSAGQLRHRPCTLLHSTTLEGMTESNTGSVFTVEPHVTHQLRRLLCSTTPKVKDENRLQDPNLHFHEKNFQEHRAEAEHVSTVVGCHLDRTCTPTCPNTCRTLHFNTTSCASQLNTELAMCCKQ